VLDRITPLIITFNEAKNVRRTLDKLVWAHRIVVVDSGSTDNTIEIIRTYRQVEVFHHAFVDFADQCNFGISQVKTAWVLSLDADYELSDEFVAKMKSLTPTEGVGGYQVPFIYRIYGRPLRGTLYPPRTVLYRKDKAVYRNEGHGHRVAVGGAVIPLPTPIFHDDRKSLARWFNSQQRYAQKEAEYLLKSDRAALGANDRIRLAVWPAPLAVFLYTLLCKGCLLDGWPGWFYTLQRMLAEIMIGLEILDRRLHRDK
jgi:cellulose synthase/poly-beta-1,6-N-acetylglucosamine synthase-like glycosyltransferase